MYEWVTIKTSYCDWIKIIMFFSVLDTIFKIKIPRDAKKFIKIPLDTSIKIFSYIPFLKVGFSTPLHIKVTGRFFHIFLHDGPFKLKKKIFDNPH